MPLGIGVCYHTAKVFTGSSRAVKFEPAGCCKNSSSFPAGERNFSAKLDSPKPYTEIAYETKTTDPTDDAYKKVSMMNNGKHNDNGNKLSRLSNLHIIWVWMKRTAVAGIVIALVVAVANSGIGIFLAAMVVFLIIRSLIRLAVRVVVTLVYIAFLLLILGLIIL